MIRVISDKDHTKIVGLLDEKYGRGICESEFIERLQQTIKQTSNYFVIERDEIIIGIVKYVLEIKLSPDKKYVGHVEDLFIIKEYRNQGFGKKLLEQCLIFLKGENCYKIILNCNNELVEFYKRVGFNYNGSSMICMML